MKVIFLCLGVVIITSTVLLVLSRKRKGRAETSSPNRIEQKESRYQTLHRHIMPFSDDVVASDYWGDDYIKVVQTELKAFDEDDWAELRADLAGQSEPWLLRLCEAARNVGGDSAEALLLENINHPHKDIAFVCLEGLQGVPGIKSHADRVLAAIERVYPSLGRLEQAVMNEFKDALAGIERSGTKMERIKEYMRKTAPPHAESPE